MSEKSAPVIKTATVNGRPLSFEQGVQNRGDNKGKQVLVPRFKAGADPDMAELAEVVSVLGQKPLLHAFGKVVRGIAVDASVEANVQQPDGSYAIDLGKFATAVNEAVADLLTAKKDEMLEELKAVQNDLDGLVAKLLTDFVTKNLKVPEELTNKILQLQLKRASIEAKVNKKSRKAAPAAAEAKK